MRFQVGLRVDDQALIASLPLAAAATDKWVVPRHCDQMHYTLPTDYQGNVPSCVGQAFSKNVEAWRWAEQDICEQVDGLAIYRRAKELDGDHDNGTTLTSGLVAAKQLWGLDGLKLHVFSPLSAKYAIHRCRGYVAAFQAREDWVLDGVVEVGKGDILGPHAVWACGYDERALWIQNSYGTSVGWQGYQRVPWEVFERDHLYGLAVDMRGG